MIREEEVFKIGQFAKPHGIKGELSLVTNSDVLEDAEDPYIVCEMDGILVPFFVEDFRYKTDTVVLVKLEDVNSEEDARMFVGKEVFYPLDAVDEEDLVGDMTWDSFIGYTVTDVQKGYLGEITDVDETTINVLLRVDHKGEELLIPAVEELITEAHGPAAEHGCHSERRMHSGGQAPERRTGRSEERRVGKECRSRWSPYH